MTPEVALILGIDGLANGAVYLLAGLPLAQLNRQHEVYEDEQDADEDEGNLHRGEAEGHERG